MNRAERRQFLRAQGWRGSKAKRHNLKAPLITPETFEGQQRAKRLVDTANRLREQGLVLSPSMLWTPEAEAESRSDVR